MSDWWAKKLGADQQQPAGIRVAPQPVPARAPAPVQHAPMQHQTTQYQQQPQAAEQPLPPNQELTMGQAIRMFKGGVAHRTEGDIACPNCGSTTGYTRYSTTYMHGGNPRPHCFNCGYNGAFQQGLESSWA